MILIIGELLNSSNTRIRELLARRGEKKLLEVAEAQLSAGASAIDLNAGMLMEDEGEALLWAARIISSKLGATVSFDTAKTDLLPGLAEEFKEGAILNSFTADEDQMELAIETAGRTGSSAIIMLKSRDGIPETAMGRLSLASRVSARARQSGLDTSRLFLDPVLTPLATARDGLLVSLDTIEGLAHNFPNFRTVGGISNVSFGLPKRRLVNRTFLAMALSRGLDAAICDPTDPDIIGTLRVAEAASGFDPGCKGFLAHHRSRSDG
jgi:5-methyltetrahydrofolate corrinoid/iron sulfur protein methyltransferase